jgi:hypothetical protein
MTLYWFLVIGNIQGILPLLISLIALYRWSQRSSMVKVTSIYLFLFGLSHIFIIFFFLILRVNHTNNIIATFFAIVELLLLLRVFALASPSQFYGKSLKIIAVCFCLLAVLNFLFLQPLQMINSNTLLLSNAILTVLAIHYFFSLLRDMPTQKLLNYPMFWIASSVLIFSAGSFFIYLITEYLVVVVQNDLLYVWTFRNILRIITFLMIAWGIWKENPQTA